MITGTIYPRTKQFPTGNVRQTLVSHFFVCTIIKVYIGVPVPENSEVLTKTPKFMANKRTSNDMFLKYTSIGAPGFQLFGYLTLDLSSGLNLGVMGLDRMLGSLLDMKPP